MSTDGPPLLRPVPRRPFDLNLISPSPEDSSPPSPTPEYSSPNLLDPKVIPGRDGGADTPSFSRTRSILNLTSSTLFGIYSPTGYSHEREEPSTPWGTGAETPRHSIDANGHVFPSLRPSRTVLQRRPSSYQPPPASTTNKLLDLTVRSILLFGFGMGYGLLVTHLHDDQKLAPFNVEGIIKPRYDWRYLLFWGIAGVALGSLLPWVDELWEAPPTESQTISASKERPTTPEEEDANTSGSVVTADWHPVVRSFGAFVGIAYAIRKLPWSSTLQASLTLALVNPVLWYILDRTKTGFLLSASIGLVGTSTLLLLNPEMMPSPASTASAPRPTATNSTIWDSNDAFKGWIAKETVECGIWIISVLFCSCVCFGNIGRRLALNTGARRGSLR